ncbi:MAG: hypothetical protein QOF37_2953 [Thermoleophilaceae bacterium]|nr:hypothetical protein [Thermoleophilaceae bacterium]
MATATSSKAPARMLRSLPPGLSRALPAAAVILLVAAVVWVVYDPWYLNYDARYALDWARDITQGLNPDFTAPYAPTPHPLSIALSLLGVPFGHSGDQVIVWLVVLAFGALVWLVYRLGAVLFNPWVGVVAALVVVSRPAMLRDTLLAYQDIWFEALIVGAVLLEAGRRRRGWPVLSLLAVAGLVRPEGWVLAGLYWLYLWRDSTPRARVLGAALVAASPVLWCLMDLIVTGDALHSLHGTAALAEVNERRLGITQSPRWTAQYFAFTLREPLMLGIPIGAIFAWRYRKRQVILPLAVAAILTVVFAIGPLFGLPLIGRYVRTPSVLIAVLYGLAVFGWMLLPRGGRDRRVWLAVGVVAALASVAYIPWHLDLLKGLHTRSVREGSLYSDLRRTGEAPVVRAAFARCAPLSAGDHRPVPYIRWWLDGKPGSVGTGERHASPMGKLLLEPRRTFLPRWFYKKNLRIAAPPPPAGYTKLYENRSWRVWRAPGC